MTNTLEIVADSDEAEHVDHVVCILVTIPLAFPDNLVGSCCRCGRQVQFRPHAPKTPPRICWDCVRPDVERERAKGELHTLITPKTLNEIQQYFRKKKMS